ncbi:UNVERIFIED_CONTAM: D-mannose binding lectin [Williamsia faeni]
MTNATPDHLNFGDGATSTPVNTVVIEGFEAATQVSAALVPPGPFHVLRAFFRVTMEDLPEDEWPPGWKGPKGRPPNPLPQVPIAGPEEFADGAVQAPVDPTTTVTYVVNADGDTLPPCVPVSSTLVVSNAGGAVLCEVPITFTPGPAIEFDAEELTVAQGRTTALGFTIRSRAGEDRTFSLLAALDTFPQSISTTLDVTVPAMSAVHSYFPITPRPDTRPNAYSLDFYLTHPIQALLEPKLTVTVTKAPAALGPGDVLRVDQNLKSPNGQYELLLQEDSNIVLYQLFASNKKATWASNTGGSGGNLLVMQSDGNLVLYKASLGPIWQGEQVWATDTAGAVDDAGGTAELRDDGHLVVHTGNVAHWATGQFEVRYNGNGYDGGVVPPPKMHGVGPHVGADGMVAWWPDPTSNPPTMTKTGAVFAYWNTKPDGSGDFYGWPEPATLFLPAEDIVLYAQWYVTTGLRNGGNTQHYAFAYDSCLQIGNLEPARTNGLIEVADRIDGNVNGTDNSDYGVMANWFPGVTATRPNGLPPDARIPIFVTHFGGGARNTGKIYLKPGLSSNIDSSRFFLVAEITESFMEGQNKGWGFERHPNASWTNEESCGEGLSLFLTEQMAQLRGAPGQFTAHASEHWLNSALPASDPNCQRFYRNEDGSQDLPDFGSRLDYVNLNLFVIGNGPGTGCSMLFLYYLHTQLGHSIDHIIAAAPGFKSDGVTLNATGTLRGVYQNLTGDQADPFPKFKALLGHYFPEASPATISGPNPNNPFPLSPPP